jgi:3-dehydroquinate dehydratase-2
MSAKTVFVLNGPNLNLLGTREPEIYGRDTLDDIAGMLEDQARLLGLTIDFRQSNHEGHLIEWLHEANAVSAKAVLLNAAGYTHTSVAILDAIKSIKSGVTRYEKAKTKPKF